MSYDAECYCADLTDAEQCVFCEMETRSRLSKLAHNLAIGAALCRSWELGRYSCPCDQGYTGNEWTPGMGCTPESIADREWNDDPHDYRGDGGMCSECGRREDSYLHSECPDCGEDITEPGHWGGCQRSVP